MRVVIFSGTTEGRELSAQTAAMGAETIVCVATEYGRTIQQHVPGTKTHSGRLNADEMVEILQGADLCIDATHPYAKVVSQNIRQAAQRANVPHHRLLRQESALPQNCIMVDSAEQAAAFLQTTQGNVLLTTGAKELQAYAELDRERIYPRVLPMQDSLTACENLQIPRGNIIAMQGPFSYELNCALLRQFSIRWMVTKDGGAAGGFDEKVQAAQENGVQLVVIRRPQEEGESYQTILALCKEMIGCR